MATIKHKTIYNICLADMQSRKHKVEAIGMDSLLAIDPAPEVRELTMQFPSANQYEKEVFSRPYGKVQLMLGMASQSLHCTHGMEAGELRLNKNVLYPAWVLTGCADVSWHTN